MMLKTTVKWFSAVSLFINITHIHAATTWVHCDAGDSLQATVSTALPGDVINVTGKCNEAIVIKTNDLTLSGGSADGKAMLSGESLFFPMLVSVESAVRVSITGLVIENGLFGVYGKANASFSLTDVEVSNNIIGVNVESNSHLVLTDVTISNSDAIGLEVTSGSAVEVNGTLDISGSAAFGLDVIDNAELKLHKASRLNTYNNTLGAQIAVSATLFADKTSRIEAHNNHAIGFSINTGASVILFNADLDVSDNALEGLDVVSSANLDVDGESTLTANNNGRHGISIDDSSLNIFGFFSTQPGLPKIIASNNIGDGVQVEFGSKLDIGRNASLEITNNNGAGISLDDGSSAILHDSIITGNNGILVKDKGSESRSGADLVATFASRVTFQSNNDIGLALCDKSSMSRGDVKCTD